MGWLELLPSLRREDEAQFVTVMFIFWIVDYVNSLVVKITCPYMMCFVHIIVCSSCRGIQVVVTRKNCLSNSPTFLQYTVDPFEFEKSDELSLDPMLLKFTPFTNPSIANASTSDNLTPTPTYLTADQASAHSRHCVPFIRSLLWDCDDSLSVY